MTLQGLSEMPMEEYQYWMAFYSLDQNEADARSKYCVVCKKTKKADCSKCNVRISAKA